ncbi:MAG: hypothetical protein FWD85_05480 [Microbacteriaceae bacterium]|nr:hypothetical protein [Microbacteriaceae bacterium]MCL2794740.1 hypothetical protein [Microbacteriaceae bacterium]
MGTFVAPEPQPLAPLDDVVHDALKIAHHGVRMSVKNHLIVNALRDGKPFDERELEEFAAAEYRALAASSREAAGRAQRDIARGEQLTGRVFPGGKPVVVEPEHLRKPIALRQVADAYDAAAADSDELGLLIDEAKAEAWEEVGGTLASRLAMNRIEDDPEYLAFRDERLQHFIEDDLLAALREHAAQAGTGDD